MSEDKVLVLHHRPQEVQERIKENLIPLEENLGKKLAQEAYYSSLSLMGNSPMLREKRPPVHDRLGFKRMKRIPFSGTSTNYLMPRRRMPFQNQFRAGPKNIAQARMERIRRQLMYQSRPIKLRRPRPCPVNYTIQVRNSQTNSNNIQRLQNGMVDQPDRFKIALDKTVQAEIKAVQISSSSSMEMNVLHPDSRVKTEFSPVLLHIRFTSYMDDDDISEV